MTITQADLQILDKLDIMIKLLMDIKTQNAHTVKVLDNMPVQLDKWGHTVSRGYKR